MTETKEIKDVDVGMVDPQDAVILLVAPVFAVDEGVYHVGEFRVFDGATHDTAIDRAINEVDEIQLGQRYIVARVSGMEIRGVSLADDRATDAA